MLLSSRTVERSPAAARHCSKLLIILYWVWALGCCCCWPGHQPSGGDQSPPAVTVPPSHWLAGCRRGGGWRHGGVVTADPATCSWARLGCGSVCRVEQWRQERQCGQHSEETLVTSSQTSEAAHTLTPDQPTHGLNILNFGELAGAPYSGNTHSGGGSDSESDHQVKSLMELQQQGMPGYGLYRSHYDNPAQGFPGNGRHLGGYPFPPMPGQNYSGYPHLGYPSSQSPGPREGKKYFCQVQLCWCSSKSVRRLQ